MNFTEAYLFKEPKKILEIIKKALSLEIAKLPTTPEGGEGGGFSLCALDAAITEKGYCIDPDNLDKIIQKSNLCVDDLFKLNSLSLNFLNDVYILKYGIMNDKITFEKPRDVINAFIDSIIDITYMHPDLASAITDPIELMVYLKKNDFSIDIELLEKKIACLSLTDIDTLVHKQFYLPGRTNFEYLNSFFDISTKNIENYRIAKEHLKFSTKEELEQICETLNFLNKDNLKKLISVGEQQKEIMGEYITKVETTTKETNNALKGKAQELQKAFLECDKVAKEAKKTLRDKADELQQTFNKALEELKKTSIKTKKVEITIKHKGKKTVLADNILRHAKYADTMRIIAAGVSPYLVGPAGSGKSTILEQIAYDLKLPYYPMSVNGQTSEYNIIGYNNAQGNYVRTAFRNAFEHGGVFLFEEIDAGNPNVMTVVNNSISQDRYLFPDGNTIKKHQDFIVGASANTYGRGASLQYIGRNPLDAATLDRFAMLHIDYEPQLEKALCPNQDWLDYIYEIRNAIDNYGIRVVASTRAVKYGCNLLNQGFHPQQVEEMLIWKGTPKEDIEKVKAQIVNRELYNRLFKIDIQNERGGQSVEIQQNDLDFIANAKKDDDDDNDLPF